MQFQAAQGGQASQKLGKRVRKSNFFLQPLLILFTGGTLAITGTYLLVTFAPHNSVHITAHLVQYYMLCWQFLLYLVSLAPATLLSDAVLLRLSTFHLLLRIGHNS